MTLILMNRLKKMLPSIFSILSRKFMHCMSYQHRKIQIAYIKKGGVVKLKISIFIYQDIKLLVHLSFLIYYTFLGASTDICCYDIDQHIRVENVYLEKLCEIMNKMESYKDNKCSHSTSYETTKKVMFNLKIKIHGNK